ncbi:TlpA family protein disulfide reductase [Epilithonimonas xixisoli]|uniref:AhpC/TSA family protein n=1 Tax=Epilithonimonas xixisoli TaxID=1476462 RepID=A0A4R8I720_9FLAO|nr:TlpA disulfide reductase family protein [Epilithonimonas xixisoli]TDX84783.1 AhpC/TSA family protein [Epilithonimonas xixisoli]
MNIKLRFVFFVLFLSINGFAQNNYYSILGGKPFDEEKYKSIKENVAKHGKVEEVNLKTVIKKDSAIHYVKIGTVSLTPDAIDPYEDLKKLIGTKFKIEKFVDDNSKNFKNNYLNGKPTLINFWFTRCPPCIEELPTLNSLKEKYGNTVNFISITFENQKAVETFLKKYEYRFKHIPNSKKQIDELNISSYPSNLILDKNGIVKIAESEIVEQNVKGIEKILDILL